MSGKSFFNYGFTSKNFSSMSCPCGSIRLYFLCMDFKPSQVFHLTSQGNRTRSLSRWRKRGKYQIKAGGCTRGPAGQTLARNSSREAPWAHCEIWGGLVCNLLAKHYEPPVYNMGNCCLQNKILQQKNNFVTFWILQILLLYKKYKKVFNTVLFVFIILLREKYTY